MEFDRFFSWLSGFDKTLAKAIKNQILICERERQRESHLIASHAILTSSYLATTSPLSNVPNIQTSRVIFPKTPILSNVQKKKNPVLLSLPISKPHTPKFTNLSSSFLLWMLMCLQNMGYYSHSV